MGAGRRRLGGLGLADSDSPTGGAVTGDASRTQRSTSQPSHCPYAAHSGTWSSTSAAAAERVLGSEVMTGIAGTGTASSSAHR